MSTSAEIAKDIVDLVWEHLKETKKVGSSEHREKLLKKIVEYEEKKKSEAEEEKKKRLQDARNLLKWVYFLKSGKARYPFSNPERAFEAQAALLRTNKAKTTHIIVLPIAGVSDDVLEEIDQKTAF